MQLEACCKICLGLDIICFIPYKEVTFSGIVPSSIIVSLTDDDFDLVLKSTSHIRKGRSKLFILIKSFSKMLIKEWNASDV